MALGKSGDIGTFTWTVDNASHYCVVLDTPDATHNLVAFKLSATANGIKWSHEAVTTAVAVLSGTDALHG